METHSKVEKVINPKSWGTRLSLRREPAYPAHFKGGDGTTLSQNIIITYTAESFTEREGRMKTFLNMQGLKMGREVVNREYWYYSLR